MLQSELVARGAKSRDNARNDTRLDANKQFGQGCRAALSFAIAVEPSCG